MELRQASAATSKDFSEICYTSRFGAVPKWPKGEVCKTSIRGFESHPRLQTSRFNSVDYNSRLFSGIPTWELLGTTGKRTSSRHSIAGGIKESKHWQSRIAPFIFP